MYYVYIVKCSDDSLYTGVAADICRRMQQHISRSGEGAKYTRSHPVKELVALWKSHDKSSAFKLEYAIKKLKREEKLKLIYSPDDIHESIPSLCGEDYLKVVGVTLEECLVYAEKKMSEDEKEKFIRKLNA
ncbi:MAG: GIY-YIG nuclease family protein [Oscillospiraceae bacterium]|nr:GIY-YIG nuclease family protein [Oscillospiraceae bacterium]